MFAIELGGGLRKVPPMDVRYLQVAHVLSIILFLAATFVAFADPRPDRKKRMAMLTGILGLLAFVTGFGLLDMAGHASSSNALRYPIWSYVKMAVWLVLMALGAAVFRQPSRAGAFRWLTVLLVATALVMVYFRPF